MARIIIDTNFLLIPYQFRIDIFDEFSRIAGPSTLLVIDKTIDELKRLNELKARKAREAASIALLLLKRYPVGIIKTDDPFKDVDQLILDNAKANDLVATQDIALKKKLIEKGISVIIMRKKSHLEIVGA